MKYKTVTVTQETIDMLDGLWIDYVQWDTLYEVDFYDARPYLLWWGIAILLIIACLAINSDLYISNLCW